MIVVEIKHNAVAGTLESSDIQIMVDQGTNGIELSLESSVIDQYGEQIEETIRNVVEKLGLENVKIQANDQGALECTIRSRVQTALFRANDQTEDLPWGSKI